MENNYSNFILWCMPENSWENDWIKEIIQFNEQSFQWISGSIIYNNKKSLKINFINKIQKDYKNNPSINHFIIWNSDYSIEIMNFYELNKIPFILFHMSDEWLKDQLDYEKWTMCTKVYRYSLEYHYNSNVLK